MLSTEAEDPPFFKFDRAGEWDPFPSDKRPKVDILFVPSGS